MPILSRNSSSYPGFSFINNGNTLIVEQCPCPCYNGSGTGSGSGMFSDGSCEIAGIGGIPSIMEAGAIINTPLFMSIRHSDNTITNVTGSGWYHITSAANITATKNGDVLTLIAGNPGLAYLGIHATGSPCHDGSIPSGDTTFIITIRSTRCTGDSDCPDGQRCIDGFCTPMIPEYECADDSPCPSGQACIGGYCIDIPCTNNSDCPSGQECVDGTCMPVSPECTSDSNCPSGQRCVNGFCISVDCTNNSHCPDGQKCIDGFCVPIDCDPPQRPLCTVAGIKYVLGTDCTWSPESVPQPDNVTGQCSDIVFEWEASVCDWVGRNVSAFGCPAGFLCVGGICVCDDDYEPVYCNSHCDCAPGSQCLDVGLVSGQGETGEYRCFQVQLPCANPVWDWLNCTFVCE